MKLPYSAVKPKLQNPEAWTLEAAGVMKLLPGLGYYSLRNLNLDQVTLVRFPDSLLDSTTQLPYYELLVL